MHEEQIHFETLPEAMVSVTSWFNGNESNFENSRKVKRLTMAILLQANELKKQEIEQLAKQNDYLQRIACRLEEETIH